MDPTESNWLILYLQLRLDFSLPKQEGEVWTTSKKIYSYLQPTGIIYGHPIELPKEIKIDFSQWPVKERLEVIFLESLISAYLFENDIEVDNIDSLHNAVKEIVDFYESTFPEYLKKGIFEPKAKNDEQQLERILRKRITVKPEWNAEFWRGFFHNILLFLDVIVFVEFNKAKKANKKFDTKSRIIELQQNIIQLLSVIINLDEEKNSNNANFLGFFIDSTILDKKEKDKARDTITHPEIEKIFEFLSNSPWIIKKYYLELAILSIWADNHVKLAEKDFIDNLSKKLDIKDLDFEESTYAVESFVLLHWQQVHYLQSKQNYLILSKRITRRMLAISKKYGNQIKLEIEENKELVELLKLSQKRPLSIEEKEMVRSQLIDVLKTVPVFVILALPMAFLTVPILMKILPKNLFPSSFDPNRLTSPMGKNYIEE